MSWTFREMVDSQIQLRKQPKKSEFNQVNGRPFPLFYIPKDEKDTGALEEYRQYMLDTYGHIINSPMNETPKEVIDFLGEPKGIDHLPEWLQEACNGVEEDVYNPGETKEQKEEKGEMLKRIKESRLARKINHRGLVTTERGFTNHLRSLLAGNECLFQGTFDHRTQMILDVISHKLLNQNPKTTASIAIRKNDEPSYTVEEIEEILHEEPMKVILTDKEIKQILGLEGKISNREIYQAVMDLVEVEVEGELPVYYNPETGAFRSIVLGGAERHFMGVVIDKTGRKSRRTGYEENVYCFTFTTLLSRTLLTNIMNGNIMLKDNRFYRMKAGAQNIGNCLLPWQSGTRLSLKELSKLAGLKLSRTDKQQQLVENYLSELREQKFISGWKKYGRGKKAFYWVWKKNA